MTNCDQTDQCVDQCYRVVCIQRTHYFTSIFSQMNHALSRGLIGGKWFTFCTTVNYVSILQRAWLYTASIRGVSPWWTVLFLRDAPTVSGSWQRLDPGKKCFDDRDLLFWSFVWFVWFVSVFRYLYLLIDLVCIVYRSLVIRVVYLFMY